MPVFRITHINTNIGLHINTCKNGDGDNEDNNTNAAHYKNASRLSEYEFQDEVLRHSYSMPPLTLKQFLCFMTPFCRYNIDEFRENKTRLVS